MHAIDMDFLQHLARALPNSSGFDKWLTSPVCTTKAGAWGSALMSAIARPQAADDVGIGFLRKPMCVSLICESQRIRCGS
jgi:hypothetical protein